MDLKVRNYKKLKVVNYKIIFEYNIYTYIYMWYKRKRLSIAACIKSLCNRRSRRARVCVRTSASRTKGNCERNCCTRVSVIRPHRMIICSDWLTTLRCGITLGYKKDDGIGCKGRRSGRGRGCTR
jgi:hypothetical protein